MNPTPIQPRIGIFGGSGLYRMEGLTDVREQVVDTPFGAPSDAFLLGRLGGAWTWPSWPDMAAATD